MNFKSVRTPQKKVMCKYNISYSVQLPFDSVCKAPRNQKWERQVEWSQGAYNLVEVL